MLQHVIFQLRVLEERQLAFGALVLPLQRVIILHVGGVISLRSEHAIARVANNSRQTNAVDFRQMTYFRGVVEERLTTMCALTGIPQMYLFVSNLICKRIVRLVTVAAFEWFFFVNLYMKLKLSRRRETHVALLASIILAMRADCVFSKQLELGVPAGTHETRQRGRVVVIELERHYVVLDISVDFHLVVDPQMVHCDFDVVYFFSAYITL